MFQLIESELRFYSHQITENFYENGSKAKSNELMISLLLTIVLFLKILLFKNKHRKACVGKYDYSMLS